MFFNLLHSIYRRPRDGWGRGGVEKEGTERGRGRYPGRGERSCRADGCLCLRKQKIVYI